MLTFEEIVERVAMTDNPKAGKTKPLQVIAGAPDRPLKIGNIEIPCYVTEDEIRVLSQRGITRAMGMNPEAGFRLPQLLSSKAVKPFVSNELVPAFSQPLVVKNPAGGGNMLSCRAETMIEICKTVLVASQAGVLSDKYDSIVERATILLEGFATVGIIALIDEATGYQEIRAKSALATILEEFIATKLQRWTKTFPYEFYSEICRLKGWPAPHEYKRPIVFAKYTNDLVYERLAPGVLSELKKRNPADTLGRRRHKYFQWFTPEHGHPKHREHLSGIIMLMNSCDDWDTFYNSLNKARKKFKLPNSSAKTRQLPPP